MDILKLIGLFLPLAIQTAQALHPMSGSGAVRLKTATTIVKAGINTAVESGLVPHGAADAVDIVAHINDAVAAATEKHGDVPALPIPLPAAA